MHDCYVCDLFMFNTCFYLSICSVLVHSSHNTVCGRVKMVMRAISSRSLCVIGSAMHSTAIVQSCCIEFRAGQLAFDFLKQTPISSEPFCAVVVAAAAADLSNW